MYTAISSNKFVKSLRNIRPLPIGRIVTLILFFQVIIVDFALSYSSETVCSSDLKSSQITNQNTFLLNCALENLQKSDLVVIKSQTGEIVGLVQFLQTTVHGKQELKLITIKSDRLLQPDDYFEELKLEESELKVKGTSYLWKSGGINKGTKSIYKPLFTQGTTIGETAQNLFKEEWFFNVFGTLGYGAWETISFSTNLAAFAVGSPNGKIKGSIFRNENQTWAISISMAQERNSSEKLFNVDLIWDSILTDKLIAHSLISAAVISFDSARDVAAVKSYGSSSIQTGYEFIFDDWSRFLVGPSYNIDKKALGGYVGYVKIYDQFHIQTSLTSNNVREFKMSAKEGYLLVLDAYWRW